MAMPHQFAKHVQTDSIIREINRLVENKIGRLYAKQIELYHTAGIGKPV